jgi:type VI secretion system protein VasJ
MLGVMKPRDSWRWAACGKHPAARDFINVGEDFPLMRIFSDWVVKGYEGLVAQKIAYKDHVSWRFWAREAMGEALICGLLKDSSDSIGRRFPLLIIGTGSLGEWEDHWDLLPLSFENTWDQMEHIASQRSENIKKLASDVRNLRPPRTGWIELKATRDQIADSEMKSSARLYDENFEEYNNGAAVLLGKSESFIPLEHTTCRDQNALIAYWHFTLKCKKQSLPSASFMGGTLGNAYLAFFQRPLVSEDFIHLWTTSGLSELRMGGA